MENLKRILGMLGDEKRIYQIHEENEVDREEFQFCQLMHQLVFGEKGFAETLGPTWNMIHDPRFTLIENKLVRSRRAVFGGDADAGKQYIFDDGTFTSSVTDLEQYAEILGEGRNFHNVLTHPNEKCLVRQWLERIWKGYSLVKPHLSLKCSCDPAEKVDPSTFKDQPDKVLWQYILQECPNRAFNKTGEATAYGHLMFDLLRADLVGLIHDYAETPLIDSYIYLRDNDVVVSAENVQEVDPHGLDHQRVLQEIDILESALTHRATLRATAAKILNQLGFEKMLQKLADEGKLDMTDLERDDLLRIVYESNWPEDKVDMINRLMMFISTRTKIPFAERQAMHLEIAKNASQEFISGLKDGSIKPINHYTEPTVEVPTDANETDVMRYTAVMDSLTKNPFKGELFQIYVAAESEGELGVLDILSPIFDPNFEMTEDIYNNFLRAITRKARSLRVMEAVEVVPRGAVDTGAFVPELDTQDKEERFDYIGQRENPDKPGTWQVQLRDGTWHDTKFPDPPKKKVEGYL